MSVLSALQAAFARTTLASSANTFEELKRRVLILNSRAWENRLEWALIERWLQNFNGRTTASPEVEQLHALHLLAQFLYFGSTEIRILMQSLFRDLVLIPAIQRVREAHGRTRDMGAIEPGLRAALAETRFLGVGSPSESGVHLLYYFRQENRLKKTDFLDNSMLLERTSAVGDPIKYRARYPNVKHYIFVDDVCGSGDTAIAYSNQFLSELKNVQKDCEFHYYCLFGLDDGLNNVRRSSLFGPNCRAVFELDESFRCMSPTSRFLSVVPSGIDPAITRHIAQTYGSILLPVHPLGFENSQLLMGFSHNTPDNTIPIIWMEPDHGCSHPWVPVFRRYPKI